MCHYVCVGLPHSAYTTYHKCLTQAADNLCSELGAKNFWDKYGGLLEDVNCFHKSGSVTPELVQTLGAHKSGTV